MGSASIERGARRWISEVRSICPSVLLLHSSYCTVELRYKVLLLRMDPPIRLIVFRPEKAGSKYADENKL